jgi:fructokinase
VPGSPVQVADTVGAGDSFGAALIAALLDHGALGPDAGRPLDSSLISEALNYAVAASAITCTRTGSYPPSRAEIEAQLAGGSAEGHDRSGAKTDSPLIENFTNLP